jgi:hypothetical protein
MMVKQILLAIFFFYISSTTSSRQNGLQCARLYEGRNYEGETKELSGSISPKSLEDWRLRAQSAVVKNDCILTLVDSNSVRRVFEKEIYCLWTVKYLIF